MKIFIDFDDVIFHTNQFITDLKKIFVSRGIDKQIFDKTYKTFLSSGSVNMKTYDPWRHIVLLEEITGRKLTQLNEGLDDFLNDTHKYVFPDVIPFLTKVGKINSFVASHGSSNFQLAKIRSSKIDEFVVDVKVSASPKWQSIYDIARVGRINLNDEIYFIDDKALHVDEVKEKYPQIRAILMKRPEGRYKDQSSHLADNEVSSLADLLSSIT